MLRTNLDAGHAGGVLDVIVGVRRQFRVELQVGGEAVSLHRLQLLDDVGIAMLLQPSHQLPSIHPLGGGVNDDVVLPGVVTPAVVVQPADRHGPQDVAIDERAARWSGSSGSMPQVKCG